MDMHVPTTSSHAVKELRFRFDTSGIAIKSIINLGKALHCVPVLEVYQTRNTDLRTFTLEGHGSPQCVPKTCLPLTSPTLSRFAPPTSRRSRILRPRYL